MLLIADVLWQCQKDRRIVLEANLKKDSAKLKLLHLKFKYYSVLLLAPCFLGRFFLPINNNTFSDPNYSIDH